MTVVVEKIGNRIYLRSPWQPGMPEKCKSIPGARWNKTAKAWTYACDLEVCRMMREVFPDLQIGPDLNAWAIGEVARERAATNMLRSSSMNYDEKSLCLPTRVRELTPRIEEAMRGRGYQVPGARFLAYARTALIADEPGMGKTIQTLAALVENLPKGGRALVLCPRTAVRSVWLPEIEKWLEGFPHTVTCLSGLTPAKLLVECEKYNNLPDDGRVHFLVGNAELVRIQSTRKCTAAGQKSGCDGTFEWCEFADKHKGDLKYRLPTLFQYYWDAIIADETHRWLINIRGKSASQVGRGFSRLKSTEDGLRYAMTGTPLKGKKYNLWGTLNWLRPKVYTSKWAWVETYFEIINGEYSRSIGELKPEREEALMRSLDALCLRRTKAEIRKINPAWMPPDKIYHAVTVEMDPKQKKAYAAILKDAEVKLKGGLLNVNGVLAEFTRLKQIASCYGSIEKEMVKKRDKETGEQIWVELTHYIPELPSGKFDWLLDFLDERGIEATAQRNKGKGDLSDEVHKVVIASQFTRNINLWAAELVARGIQCYVLTGETKDKDRAAYVKAFQSNDDVRVFLINTMAGGVSITLDAADDIVIMDETWIPDEQLQVEDRVHRASNVEHQVNVWYVRAEETIEQLIALANFGKAESNFVMLDKRRALEFVGAQYGIEPKED